jgi:sigma-E factor negative regulatory protein RseA
MNSAAISGESLSALADGLLRGDELAQTMLAIGGGGESLRTWHRYQVVGDVLRSPELAPGRDDFVFLARLERRLEEEPGYPRVTAERQRAVLLPRVVEGDGGGANAPLWRWKMVAGTACTALVVVLGAGQFKPAANGGLAQVSAPLQSQLVERFEPTRIASDTAQVMLRDPALDRLLAAHQQLGGLSALQRPSGFLRNATYERPAR